MAEIWLPRWKCRSSKQLRRSFARKNSIASTTSRVDRPNFDRSPPELHDLLDDIAVLVHLDRVDALVCALVAVFGDGAPERLVELDDAAFEHVGEANEQRQADPAARDLVDQVLEIDARTFDAGRV